MSAAKLPVPEPKALSGDILCKKVIVQVYYIGVVSLIVSNEGTTLVIFVV